MKDVSEKLLEVLTPVEQNRMYRHRYARRDL